MFMYSHLFCDGTTTLVPLFEELLASDSHPFSIAILSDRPITYHKIV